LELKQQLHQQNIDLKITNDQLKKNGIMRVEEDKGADLHTSLEALVVSEENDQANSMPAPQDTTEKKQRKI
jgi:hypothetical protein